MLPKQSKKQMDALIAECQDAQYKLEVVPTTTLEFVESLTFLDEIQLRVSLSVPAINSVHVEVAYWHCFTHNLQRTLIISRA